MSPRRRNVSHFFYVCAIARPAQGAGYAQEFGYDLDGDGLGDEDYNDMVLEATAQIPEVGGGLTILLTCGALALLRRRTA